jgi:hypothetical protein
MDNLKSPQNVSYILRHLLLFNIPDLLSDENRGYADYTQYFSGTNTSGQINYLERKPVTGGRVIVIADGVKRTITTHYTINSTTGILTWTGYTPLEGKDNISIEYTAVKPWIYDDHPSLSNNYWPRLTIKQISNTHTPMGIGTYFSYESGLGDLITGRFHIIIRTRKNNNYYTFNSIKYKNKDVIDAISDAIITYLNKTKYPMPWRFNYWRVLTSESVDSEEDFGIFRNDIVIECQYYHKSTVDK